MHAHLMIRSVSAGVLLAALMQAAFPASPADTRIEEFPRFDVDSAEPVVIIASIAYGGPLSLPECEPPRGLCLDTDPMWLHVTVEQPVLGDVPEYIRVATTFSNTRLSMELNPDTPRLLALRRHGGRYILGRGYSAYANRTQDGDYIIPLVHGPLFWLPCEANDAKVEISPRDVAPFMWWPLEDGYVSGRISVDDVVIDGERWRPREGLSANRLGDTLARVSASGAAFACASDR